MVAEEGRGGGGGGEGRRCYVEWSYMEVLLYLEKAKRSSIVPEKNENILLYFANKMLNVFQRLTLPTPRLRAMPALP